MINSAAVSSLSPEKFHEASEGLGILPQLPPRPGAHDNSHDKDQDYQCDQADSRDPASDVICENGLQYIIYFAQYPD